MLEMTDEQLSSLEGIGPKTAEKIREAATVAKAEWDSRDAEAERLEAERVEAERVEAERVEAERVEAERLAAEQAAEAERLAAEAEAAPVGEPAAVAESAVEGEAAAKTGEEGECGWGTLGSSSSRGTWVSRARRSSTA